jgi:hypothetical protein
MSKRAKIIVLLIIVSGLVIRLVGINTNGLWHDELQSVTHATMSLAETVRLETGPSGKLPCAKPAGLRSAPSPLLSSTPLLDEGR